MRLACALVLSLLLPGAYAVETPDYLLLVLESPPPDGIIARDLDWAAFLKEAPVPVEPSALLEQDDELRPVPLQYDAQDHETGRLLLQLPGDLPPGARIRLYPAAGPEPAPPPEIGVSASSEDGVITVNNGIIEAVHNPAVLAGLPSKITFHKTGRVFEDYILNDRLYHPELGAFGLRFDTEPEVRLLSSGPIEAVIEVRARYIQDGTPAPGNARAVYRFRYRAGSPAVAIDAVCTQDELHSWQELHLAEWHFPSPSLSQWAAGAPFQQGTFQEDAQTYQGVSWGCLTDGRHLFGLYGGPILLYSGATNYGRYVHGPWVPWDSLETELHTMAWLDAGDDAVAALSAAATAPSRPARTRISTARLEVLREALVERLDAAAREDRRAQHAAWSLSWYNRPAIWEASLEETQERLQSLLRIMEEPGSQGAGEPQTQQVRLYDGALGAIAFNPADGRVLPSLFSLTGRREFLTDDATPLWALAVEDSDGRESLWNSMDAFFSCEAANPDDPADRHTRARLIWTGHGEATGFTATVDMALETLGLAMTLTIANDTDAITVNRVDFPVLSLGRIGDSADDDCFLAPTVSGTLWPAPLVNGLSVRAEYPGGWGSMQFGAHYDDDAGLYIAVHDPVASAKRFRAFRHGTRNALDVRIEWPVPDASLPGNDFDMPGPAVLAAFQGDWFDAAGRYRAWAEREAAWWPAREHWGRPDIPAWLLDLCVWGRPSGAASSAVPQTLAFADYMGVPTAVHWYNWHEIPFDNDYPHYFPAKEGFAEGVAALQDAGVRVMPYINGRLWDSDTSDFQTIALPAATKKRNGEPYIEHYGENPEDLVPMCPTQKVWQDKVQEIVLRLLGPEFNVDGVYIDQVAAAPPAECYDRSHGHPLGGGAWWTTLGYWPMLTELNAVIDREFPEKMLTSECTAEPFTHLFDGYLTWHFQYNNAVPAFAAVYGGKIVLFGRSDGGEDLQAHWARTGQALVWGEQLGWYSTDYVERLPRAAEYLRRCARVRSRLLPYLARGRMLRPPAPSGELPQVSSNWAWGGGDWPVTTPALQTGAWRAEDGSVAVIFANTLERPLSFSWVLSSAEYGLSGESRPCSRVTEDGAVAAEPVTPGAECTLTLGPLAVSALVIPAG